MPALVRPTRPPGSKPPAGSILATINTLQKVLKISDTASAVWGISKIIRSGDTLNEYYASIRIFSRKQVRKQLEFEVTYGDQPAYGELIMIKNPLIEGVEHVFIYHTLSEACGVSSSDHYLLETANRLQYLDAGYSVGEAAIFHSSVEFVFPTKEKEERGAEAEERR